MTKNPIKLLRNPNSPEAISSRLDGYAPPPFESTQIIDDPDAKLIVIDLTTDKVDQRVNYALTGGTKDHMAKKLIRASLHVDSEGRSILTSYYTDIRNHQWLMIKQIHERLPITGITEGPSPSHFPSSTVSGSYGGFFSSAPGQTWYNQGRSIKKIHEAQDKEESDVPIQPNTNQDKIQPTDEFFDDFTGN